ncbi:MAG: hypothetical protein M9939_04235 [Mesorhizobium sp.]|nr:hypothetical protein [Mesorhizobium sp.]MCO5160318.1 hypothetical protein [Mesorhizobium sp.]
MRYRRALRRVVISALAVMAALAIAYAAAWTATDRSGLARSIAWGDADVDDYTRFPARAIPASGAPHVYEKAEGYPDGLPAFDLSGERALPIFWPAARPRPFW